LVRDVIARAPFADLDAIGRPPTDAETAVIAREIDAHYENFVAHVARARGMTREEVDLVARGRVWTGSDAASRKLVDRLGGLDDALDILRAELRLAKADARLDPEPHVIVGRPPSRRDPSPDSAKALLPWVELLALIMPRGMRDDARALALLTVALQSRARVAAIALVAPPS
jgi:protease-4